MHRTKDIRLGRLTHWILLIIRQNNHIFPRIAKIPIQVCRHVFDVVDTPS